MGDLHGSLLFYEFGPLTRYRGCELQGRGGENFSPCRHCERSEAIQSGLRYAGLPRRHAPRNDEAGYVTIACKVAIRSASSAGLSRRMRDMRGKRIASPDLWRLLLWIESKATSSTSDFSTSRTGPKRFSVLSRTNLSSHFSSSSVKDRKSTRLNSSH